MREREGRGAADGWERKKKEEKEEKAEQKNADGKRGLINGNGNGNEVESSQVVVGGTIHFDNRRYVIGPKARGVAGGGGGDERGVAVRLRFPVAYSFRRPSAVSRGRANGQQQVREMDFKGLRLPRFSGEARDRQLAGSELRSTVRPPSRHHLRHPRPQKSLIKYKETSLLRGGAQTSLFFSYRSYNSESIVCSARNVHYQWGRGGGRRRRRNSHRFSVQM